MSLAVIGLARSIATRPEFDGLHDPDRRTPLIEPYYDPAGFPTQGYGRLLSRQRWADLRQWPAIDWATAAEWLDEDLGKAYRAVLKLCPVELADHEAAALTDFAFNCGAGNLEISTLRRLVNRGDRDGAAGQFGRWVMAGGIKLPGLVRRRAAERDLYLGLTL